MIRNWQKTALQCLFLSLIIMVNNFVLTAQKVPAFDGTWIIDHTKSDAAVKDYQITCNITQSTRAMTVEQIFQTKDGQKTSMQPVTFNLDGIEAVKEEQGGTDKVTALVSADRKTITTKFIRTMNGSDFGSVTTYTLSADGKTLTVKSSDLKGELQMIQVYRKK